MLQITIPGIEFFNDATEEFVTTKPQTLHLEHSLVSISKWECTWEKPFLGKEPLSVFESNDYVRCMTLTQNVGDFDYQAIPQHILNKINAYIDAPMTATWFPKTKRQTSREIITSEVIYYWMISNNIPFECQKWHLNRLLTLIQVCHRKNAPQKKMSKKDLMSRNANLNAQRKAALDTTG